MMGMDTGTTIRTRIVISLAPSILADSSRRRRNRIEKVFHQDKVKGIHGKRNDHDKQTVLQMQLLQR